MTGIYIAFLLHMFASLLIFQVERESNPTINTYGDALWLGLVSLTTIGYGDKELVRIISICFLSVV